MAVASKRKKREVISQASETLVEKLSTQDLLKCETLSRDVVNFKLSMHLEEQALRNMILEQALLTMKIDKQRQVLISKSTEYEAKKKLYTLYTTDMWPRYGLDGEKASLGYNDETGEIVKA
jgi:hypothetical protein